MTTFRVGFRLKVREQTNLMRTLRNPLTTLITVLLFSAYSYACSPCGALSNVTQNLVGTNLELTFTSNAGWNCCYTVNIEIVCAANNFTGTPNYFSNQQCFSGGNNTNQPYNTTIIDVSGFCPGNYKWRAVEGSCNIYTPTFNFTITGGSPLTATVTPATDSICSGSGAGVQLNAAAAGSCGSGGTVSYSWSPTTGLNNPNIANPIASPTTTTTYTVTATESASCATATASSTITVIQGSPVTASAVDDICSTSIGEVTATPDPGGTPNYTYDWPALGATTQTVTGVPAGNYTVNMTDGNGCVTSANVVVGDTPAAFQGSTTLVTCPGGSDGTAFAEMVPLLGNVTYLWDDPMAQTTQTATGLTAGNYTCTITSDVGCVGVVNVVVGEIPAMIGNIVSQSDVTCNSGNDGFVEVSVQQGTSPYSYSWTGSSSTTTIADDLYAGAFICTVTDANGCQIDIPGNIGEPPPLDITFITPSTQICPEDSIYLTASGTGGSSAYTFTWYENGDLLGTGTTIGADPDYTNTQYCVVLSEACGSPTDEECTLIYFPTPIEPLAEPDMPEKCVPAGFTFFNTSTNGSEIATTYWEFDSFTNHDALTTGQNSTYHYYPNVGTYDVTMTVTSIYGCVYTNTVSNIVSVIPTPTAYFNLVPNPTDWLNTTVQVQNASSSDVIEWEYYSPDSSPTSSTDPNPLLSFPEGAPGDYPVTLIVTTELGCKDTITLIMNIIDPITIYAPNTFTPDGDEFNQHWQPYINGIDIYDFDLYIFNRWGELIWESHDPAIGWDGTYHGKIVQEGTYIWKMTVKDPLLDDRYDYTGFINLLK